MSRNKETFYVVGGITVTVERVMDLVVSALEGGSNYWYYIIESRNPVDESKVPEGEWHSLERCVWGGGYLKICDKEALPKIWQKGDKEPKLGFSTRML